MHSLHLSNGRSIQLSDSVRFIMEVSLSERRRGVERGREGGVEKEEEERERREGEREEKE